MKGTAAIVHMLTTAWLVNWQQMKSPPFSLARSSCLSLSLSFPHICHPPPFRFIFFSIYFACESFGSPLSTSLSLSLAFSRCLLDLLPTSAFTINQHSLASFIMSRFRTIYRHPFLISFIFILFSPFTYVN